MLDRMLICFVSYQLQAWMSMLSCMAVRLAGCGGHVLVARQFPSSGYLEAIESVYREIENIVDSGCGNLCSLLCCCNNSLL